MMVKIQIPSEEEKKKTLRRYSLEKCQIGCYRCSHQSYLFTLFLL